MYIPGPRPELVYRILSGDDSDERSCEAIPESECTEVPRNYLLNVANGAATKLAEQLAGPNLVLPWLLGALGSPVFLVGLLMPTKQAGSLLPQLAVAARIRALARRKWVWVAAGSVQALCLLSMIAAALYLPAYPAGVAIVVLLAAFSVASGSGSVAFQDVMGKTIPKGHRGRLLANRAAIGGVLTLLAGLALRYWVGGSSSLLPHLGLLLVAAALWSVGAVVFAAIYEVPGATSGGRNTLDEARAGVHLLGEISGFRRFLAARCALLSIELATPFFALYGSELLGTHVSALAVFVVSIGVANIVSSPFWGRFADTSSRRVMVYAGLLGGLASGYALFVGALPTASRNALVFAPAFILLAVAEAGVRLGRKTYLVDAAPAKERPLYVSVANTFAGAVALVGAVLGGIAQIFGTSVLIGLLAVLALGGALASIWMPEADVMVGDSGP